MAFWKPGGGWAVLCCLAAVLPVAAVPSKYVKQQSVKAALELEKQAAPTLARYATLKEQNLLAEEVDGEPAGRGIANRLRRLYGDAIESYYEAVDEGWAEDDADLKQARDAIEAARAKFEPCGMFALQRLGEPRLSPQLLDRMRVIVDHTADAAYQAAKGKTDDALAAFENIDKRIEALRAEAKRTLLAGQGDVPADLPKHPAFERMVAEVTRLKGTAAGAVGAANDKQKALDDIVDALKAARTKGEAAFRAAERALGVAGVEAEARADLTQQLTVLQAYQAEYPAALKLHADVAAKYGRSGMDIENKMAAELGKPLPYDQGPGYLWEQLGLGLQQVAEAQQKVPARLLADAAEQLAQINEHGEFDRLKHVDRQWTKLELAAQWAPEDPAVKAAVEGFAARKAAIAADLEKQIDARTWKGQDARFQGPGRPADLLKAAKDWLLANRPAGDQKVVQAIRIDGDWNIAERDALGQIVSYGLPVLVAWRDPADAAAGKDLVWVFELTMYTRVAKQVPPFKIAAVSGSWWMRSSKVPKE